MFDQNLVSFFFHGFELQQLVKFPLPYMTWFASAPKNPFNTFFKDNYRYLTSKLIFSMKYDEITPDNFEFVLKQFQFYQLLR